MRYAMILAAIAAAYAVGRLPTAEPTPGHAAEPCRVCGFECLERSPLQMTIFAPEPGFRSVLPGWSATFERADRFVRIGRVVRIVGPAQSIQPAQLLQPANRYNPYNPTGPGDGGQP
jgi:hypothetical protein